MAVKDLARQWIEGNDPGRKWTKQEKERLKALRARTARSIPYSEHERRAYEQKAQDEEPVRERVPGHHRKMRARWPYTSTEFVERHVGHHGVDCLFMPLSDGRIPAQAARMGYTMTAARLMCTLAHGVQGQEMVVRHKCGNGHLSCVNPDHLTWGTPEQNARDTFLHTARPVEWRGLTDEEREEILDSGKMPRVLAVELDIPCAIIELVQSGDF